VERFDVVVAGGGPAGAAAAIAAARAGRRVLLAEGRTGVGHKVGEGLPPAARRLLRALGVYEGFLADGHAPAWGLHSIWGSPELACLDYLRDPDGHGWHLDRPRFDARLRAQAADAGASLRLGMRIIGRRRAGGRGFELELSGSFREGHPQDGGRQTWEALTTSWLVDATGRAARFARKLDGQPVAADRLVGLSLFLRASSGAGDEDGTTLVEAVPEGWWYTAQLPRSPAGTASASSPACGGGRRVAVFFTDHDLPAARQARTRAGFAALLARSREVRRRLASYVPEDAAGEPRALPAATCRLAQPLGDGWIAVGDAALTCDPLASQGILTALYSGLLAGQAVAAALGGETAPLASYPAALATVFDAYQRHRALYYRQEQRFAGEPFWRRRHQPQ
jgi:flavin-dependent dehydrogenase